MQKANTKGIDHFWDKVPPNPNINCKKKFCEYKQQLCILQITLNYEIINNYTIQKIVLRNSGTDCIVVFYSCNLQMD